MRNRLHGARSDIVRALNLLGQGRIEGAEAAAERAAGAAAGAGADRQLAEALILKGTAQARSLRAAAARLSFERAAVVADNGGHNEPAAEVAITYLEEAEGQAGAEEVRIKYLYADRMPAASKNGGLLGRLRR